MDNRGPVPPTDQPIEDQAREQTGQRQIRLQIDEQKLQTCYANAFRTNGTAEEVVLDFGLNLFNPAGGQQQEGPVPMLFQLNQRVVLNYYSAKRLAVALSQVIRRHEDQFGIIELDVSKRQQKK